MIPTLAEIINILEYRITGGCDFGWICFGNNVRILDFDHDEASVVFDTIDQTVYQITVSVQFDDDLYRHYVWTHPEYVESYQQESLMRGIDITDDDTVDVQNFEDILKFIRDRENLLATQ